MWGKNKWNWAMSSRSIQFFKSELPVKLNRELGTGPSLGVGKERERENEYTVVSFNFYYADRAL